MSSKVVPSLALRGDPPPRLGGGPRGGDDPVVETDVAVDAGLGRGVLDVLEDGVPVGNRLLAVPGPEGVPQGVHVRVRADAGVAEEVPGAADAVAGLEDGVGGPRALGLEIVRGTDPREPGSDDQDVEVFGQVSKGNGGVLRGRCTHGSDAPINSSFRDPCSRESGHWISTSMAVSPSHSADGPDVRIYERFAQILYSMRGTVPPPADESAQTKGAQTRLSILAAAIVRFGRDGFRATGGRHRPERLGGTVAYAYFPSKEALFLPR